MLPAAAGGHSPPLAAVARRHSTALWIAGGVLFALVLRAPWFDAALGRDEGGVAMVAGQWSHSGPYAYGSLFLDRPPLLVELYRVFGADGGAGIRLLGALASALLVVTSTLLAVKLAGRRAAPYAAAFAALLSSSLALKSVFTPAELLAAVPSSASVLLLVTAIEDRSRRRFWLYAGAGVLAGMALLVKQSFADALVAGVVAVLAAKLTGVSWRETGRRAAAFCAGVAVMAGALAAWTAASGTSASSIYYALFGFRLDAVNALTGSAFGSRLGRLGSPVLESGLAVALAVAVVGIARLRARPVVRAALAAWLIAAAAGVMLGGSYWPHYLIALVSVSAAGAATVLARHRWVASAGVAAMAAAAIAVGGPAALRDWGDPSSQLSAVTVGHYLRARAEPGSSAYVLYADVNILYYSGLRAAFPYNWSLMMRAAPGAEVKLRRSLASPQRPTWLVQWQSTRAFGLDRSGATKRLVARNYSRVATVCGHPVLLAHGAPARAAPAQMASTSSCPATGRIS
jgi:4-amino-4-deoxy-L-arabinose transferase-like glycosyltransferase